VAAGVGCGADLWGAGARFDHQSTPPINQETTPKAVTTQTNPTSINREIIRITILVWWRVDEPAARRPSTLTPRLGGRTALFRG
jgi:hypothetical protein